MKIGVIELISLEKCKILMKIDVKVVSISSMNHTEIMGKIKKIYIKYKDFWDGGGVGGETPPPPHGEMFWMIFQGGGGKCQLFWFHV